MMEIYHGKTTKEYLQFYEDKPQEVLIETVAACNMRCIGCPQSLESYRQEKWKTPFMDENFYISILNEIKDYWGKTPFNVGLYHTGEITLLPEDKFDFFVWWAKKILKDEEGWTSIGFYTNGLLLNEERRKSILESGINWVRLSFDGGDKDAYEKVRIGGDFDVVYENARAFAREAKEAGKKIRLEIIFVPFTENEQTVGKFHHLWENTGWEHYTGGAMNYAGLMQTVEQRRHRYQGVRRKKHSIPCPRVFEQFSILSDGRVSFCSADPLGICILGDLKKQTIKEIWNGERREQVLNIHKAMKQNGMEPCRLCDYVDFCSVPDGEFFGEQNP